jgi:DNA-binding transcriptional LysR family regulator
MEFREVRSLVALGKFESIAKTAQAVNLTSAAVHKQIKNLESEFGVPLYEKSGRSVHLTRAARAILPHLQELLAQYDAVAAALTDWKGMGRGIVHIGANPAISAYLIPPLLKVFREKWPGISPILEVEGSATLLDRVANRSLDLAIGIWDESARERVTPRVRWDYEIVAVSNQPWAEPVRLKHLSGQPFVRLPQEAYLGAAVDAYLARHGCRPLQSIVVSSSHTMIAMIRNGLGIGMLPRWAVQSEVDAGALFVIPLKEPRLTGVLDLITPKSGYVPEPVRAFIDLAREYPAGELLRVRRR